MLAARLDRPTVDTNPQIQQTAGRTITVDLGERSYAIVVGAGLVDEIGPRLTPLVKGRTAALITNPAVAALYATRVVDSLRGSGFEAAVIEIPDGETYKNLTSAMGIYDRLVQARLDRTCPLIALGGGVIGDLTGFAAATYLRGIPFIQIPTTLLAQVDASVGGKTAVNHPAGKNLIGAFYQPRLVLIDVETLATLPRREFAAGMAEVIKTAAVLDAELFALLEQQLDEILAHDPALLHQVIGRCCALKAAVVSRDECEAGQRAILNFGHTLAHALESVTGYTRYLHGEAVSVGMAFAATVSRARGYCSQETRERLIALLSRVGLPVEMPSDITVRSVASAIESDKKVSGRTVKFICLEAPGRTRFEQLTVRQIAAALSE